MMNVGTWNICLGLKSKKDYVKEKIKELNLDVCCIQECEIKKDYNKDILSFRNYNIEVENNSLKSRCCIYIKNNLQYKRRDDLEGIDNNIVILELKSVIIINIYRSFAQQNDITPLERFKTQVQNIKNTIKKFPKHQLIILGDFNLNFTLVNNTNYNYKNLFDILNETVTLCNLTQIVNFPTWTRTINGIKKESILDHVYVNDITKLINVTGIETEIGDHKLVTCSFHTTIPVTKPVFKRCWKDYSRAKLLDELSRCKFDLDIDEVQQLWNNIENVIIGIVDNIAPITEFTNNFTTKTHPDILIKPKINRKRRLLKELKANNNDVKREQLRLLNKEIVLDMKKSKRSSIRRNLIAGNSKSLWNAVNLAKDINPNQIPSMMQVNGHPIHPAELSETFACFFDEKVKSIVESCKVDNDVYNGKRKVHSTDKNFMTIENVNRAIKSVKIKNCEGYDRIPQRILCEGIEYLIQPIHRLFSLIYEQKKIPEQWLISKIIPIFKKGSKNNVENYRPIANLCSMTKVYEQLIIDRLREIEITQKCDLTGKPQHGFKQKRSTATAGLTLQSILARALDQDNYAIMSSIDLSAAFDVVNVKLLLKRLQIIGLPNDIIKLIEIWLKNRMFYVDIDGISSYMKSSDTGTIQGSRLGPILYAIFVSPLFDLEKMSNYADDNFIIRFNKTISVLINDMEKSLEAITKWLKKSGLKVNENKTEACLFHRTSNIKVTIMVNNSKITSKNNMNVLGVIFDSNLNWNDQVANAISKSNKALHCIKLIKYYFTSMELQQLITSNYYSILYYNSEIWNIPNLKNELKRRLVSASANALKICTPSYHDRMSYVELHKINNRATPNEFCNYKHALLLHKLIHTEIPSSDWIDMNFQQNFNNRSTKINFFKNNRFKVGENLMCNRFNILNGKIDYDMINLSDDSYKIKCKSLFLVSTT